METQTSNTDHDLLIKLDTRMEDVSGKIETLTNTITDRSNDHEKRLRRLEASMARIQGATALITAAAVVSEAILYYLQLTKH